jgi:hypothetical protein
MGRPSQVRMNGPLALHAAGFRRELERLGYKVQRCVRPAAPHGAREPVARESRPASR